VLDATSGHVTGSEIVERLRERGPDVTPSTGYRTLDDIEELGYISHSPSSRGREGDHVLPAAAHAHLECRKCGERWEMNSELAAEMVRPVATRLGFRVDVGHMTLVGQCVRCVAGGHETTAAD